VDFLALLMHCNYPHENHQLLFFGYPNTLSIQENPNQRFVAPSLQKIILLLETRFRKFTARDSKMIRPSPAWSKTLAHMRAAAPRSSSEIKIDFSFLIFCNRGIKCLTNQFFRHVFVSLCFPLETYHILLSSN
jgi:hypothetical protein